MSPHHSPIRGGPSDAVERRHVATGGQAGLVDRVRSSAAHVVRWPRTAAAVRAPDRAAPPTASRLRRARRGLQRWTARPASPCAPLLRLPAAGASGASLPRPPPAPPPVAGPRA